MRKITSQRSRRKTWGVAAAVVASVVAAAAFAGATGLASFTAVSVKSSQGDCAFNDDFSQVNCTLGTVPVDGKATIEVVVIPTSDGYLKDTAVVRGDQPDSNPGNNTAKAKTRVKQPDVPKDADLAVTKAAATPKGKVGQPLSYTVTIINKGPAVATGVVANDLLPQFAQFNSARVSQGTCAVAGTHLDCEIGKMEVGATATITVSVTPTESLRIWNHVCVCGKEFDPNDANNCSQVGTHVLDNSVDLGVVKKDDKDPATVGQPVTTTITVTNTGPNDATNVTLKDTLSKP